MVRHPTMQRLPQKSFHPLSRRIRNRLSSWFGNRPPRNQNVFRVEIDGHSVKRVCMADSFEADSCAANLRTFGPDRIYPSLILRKENELWVEYIEGEPLREVSREALDQLARIFGILNSKDPELVKTSHTDHNHALHVDLEFLHAVGLLGAARHRELDALADRITPPSLWIGYDCTDAIRKNFVICPDGHVRGIDIESIGARIPIGSGAAKASVRWLGSDRSFFLEALAKHSVPDVRPSMNFLELAFCAFWQKNCVLEGKRHFVSPKLFDRFAD
jgi:hypothetical protein